MSTRKRQVNFTDFILRIGFEVRFKSSFFNYYFSKHLIEILLTW